MKINKKSVVLKIKLQNFKNWSKNYIKSWENIIKSISKNQRSFNNSKKLIIIIILKIVNFNKKDQRNNNCNNLNSNIKKRKMSKKI